MTERLAEVSTRIENLGQLGTVVNAMRGIAGAKAQAARTQLAAVEAYSATITAALGRTLALQAGQAPPAAPPERIAQLLFCAELGFAGAFSEHVLDQAAPGAMLFLLGTRGMMRAAERSLTPAWHLAMPADTALVPHFAGQISAALYAAIVKNGITQAEILYCRWQAVSGLRVARCRLLPLDQAEFPAPAPGAPLLNLAPAALLEALTADYVHALLCQAALHSFAAECEARMAIMTAARQHIDGKILTLEQTRRTVRQEEITAEIIELAASTAAAGRESAPPR